MKRVARQMDGCGEDALEPLLKQWLPVAPRGDFESGVWRRLHVAGARSGRVVALPAWLPAGWRLPVVLPALCSLLVIAAMGAWFGVAAGRAVTVDRAAAHPLLSAQTLSGSYLAAATRGVR